MFAAAFVLGLAVLGAIKLMAGKGGSSEPGRPWRRRRKQAAARP